MSANHKTSVQKKRVDLIKSRIEDLKRMVFSAGQNREIPRQEILNRVVEILTGRPPSPLSSHNQSNASSGSSTPSSTGSSDSLGPMKPSRREYKMAHEQARRDKEAAAYNALKAFIIENNLQGNSEKLEKLKMLNIAVEVIRERRLAPLPFSIEQILAMP